MAEEKKDVKDASVEESNTEEKKVEGIESTIDTKAEESKEEKKDETNDTCADGVCGDKKCNGTFVWLIVIVLVIGGIIFYQQRNNDTGEEKEVSDKVGEEVSSAATKLIEEQLVAPGTEVVVGKITEESGLYKIEIVVAGQELTSYMTKDKMKFIPQLIDVAEMEEVEGEEAQDTPAIEVQTKSDKPEVELFVMSYCPYGTQMEKGILPVLDALGDSVDAELKFVDYVMHGAKEVKENLRQYCIKENEPAKINAYLTCFLASAEGSDAEAQACLVKTNVNQTALNQCVTKTDAEYKITELLEDKASWVSGQFPQFNVDKDDVEKYGVQGSPTLVVNGEVIQTGRDSASIMTAICSAFNEQPEACQTQLSSASPEPGFGTGVAAAGGASEEAACGV